MYLLADGQSDILKSTNSLYNIVINKIINVFKSEVIHV